MALTRIEQEFLSRVPSELRQLNDNIERLAMVLMLSSGVTKEQLEEALGAK